MGEESKIIEFPDNRGERTTSSDNYCDEPEEFEAWEPLVEFCEKENYAAQSGIDTSPSLRLILYHRVSTGQ